MNVSSVVLRASPAALESVRGSLQALPGVEVHAATGDGRLVLTIEDSGTARAADTFVQLHGIRGVMSVSMIYQYSDETDERESRS
jgi:nitrate reductase NapD